MTDKTQQTPEEGESVHLLVLTQEEVRDIKRVLFWGFILIYGAIMHSSLMEAKWWEIAFFVIAVMALSYNANPMGE